MRFTVSLGPAAPLCLLGLVALGLSSTAPAPKKPASALRPPEPYSWRNVQIVGGGFITGIVFSPARRDLVYARTDIGGAYRWNPSMRRWVPLTDWVSQAESNLLGVESIAADPMDARRVYLALGTYTQSWAGNGAVLRSIDQGRTWQRTDMPLKMGGNEDGRSMGERLAVDPSDGRVLLFGSRHDGLWRSRDWGASWTRVAGFPAQDVSGSTGIGFLLFDPRSGQRGSPTPTIYAGAASPTAPVLRSTDAGTTWQPVPGQPIGLLPYHGVLASDGSLYLTYSDGPGPNGVTRGAVWRLETGSDRWTDITPVAPGQKGEGSFGYAGLSVDARHPQTLMVSTLDRWSAGDDIFRSTDGGAHWTALKPKSLRDSSAAPYLNWGRPSAELGHWIGDLEIDPFRPAHVLYVTGATLWGSDDATQVDRGRLSHWTVRAQGLEETAVEDLISPPVGAPLLSALGDLGGFRHDSLDESPRDGMLQNPLLTTGTSLDYAEQRPMVIARVGRGSSPSHGALSTDGGLHWTPFATEPARNQGSGAVTLSADGRVMLWMPERGLAHRSADSGATWNPCQGIPAGSRPVADRIDPQRFYAADPQTAKLLRSTDGGRTFGVAGALPATSRVRLRASPAAAGDLWLAAYADGLFHSTNAGASFQRVTSVQEGGALGFGKAPPGRRYPTLFLTGKVGGTSGVFRSDDGSRSWGRINDDQHQYGWIGQVITGDPRVYGRVYLGTNGRGVLVGAPAAP